MGDFRFLPSRLLCQLLLSFCKPCWSSHIVAISLCSFPIISTRHSLTPGALALRLWKSFLLSMMVHFLEMKKITVTYIHAYTHLLLTWELCLALWGWTVWWEHGHSAPTPTYSKSVTSVKKRQGEKSNSLTVFEKIKQLTYWWRVSIFNHFYSFRQTQLKSI